MDCAELFGAVDDDSAVEGPAWAARRLVEEVTAFEGGRLLSVEKFSRSVVATRLKETYLTKFGCWEQMAQWLYLGNLPPCLAWVPN